jgi:hypothetical protein
MKTLVYTDDFEQLLKKEGEECESMSILHTNAHLKFSRYSVYINMPVIFISAAIGFLSPLPLFFRQDVFLGALSIFIGLLKTLDSYFTITKRSETHRMVSLNYLRISRWIRLQLCLEKEYRIPAHDLYDIISHDLQNIREAEPVVPLDVIANFNAKYKDEATAKPAVTNGLTSIKINRKSPVSAAPDVPVEIKAEEPPPGKRTVSRL